MNSDELVAVLKRMHQKGLEKREANAMLVLFGIIYSDDLNRSDIQVDDIAVCATGRKGPYVRAGMKLTRYVEINEHANRLNDEHI